MNQIKIADGIVGDKQVEFIENIVNKLCSQIDVAVHTLIDHNLVNEDIAEQVMLEMIILSYLPFFEDRETFDMFIVCLKEQYEAKLKTMEGLDEQKD